MSSVCRARLRAAGFTLVEVLVVVVIVGIAGAVIVPQILRPGSLGIQAAGRLVIADILYAQNDAIAQQAVRRLVFDPVSDSYRITDGGGDTLSVGWKEGTPVNGNYIVDFQKDTRFGVASLENVTFGGGLTVLEFDAMGAPNNGGSLELVADPFRYRVSVAPFTGRVTIAPVTAGG